MPHEVLELLVRRGDRVNLEDVHLISGESLARLKRILCGLKRAVIACSLWGYHAPCNWDRSEPHAGAELGPPWQ